MLILKIILTKKFEAIEYHRHIIVRQLSFGEISELRSVKDGLIATDNTMRLNFEADGSSMYSMLLLFGNNLTNKSDGLSAEVAMQLKNDLIEIKAKSNIDMVIFVTPVGAVKSIIIKDCLQSCIFIEAISKEEIENHTHDFYFNVQNIPDYHDAIEINKFADIVSKRLNEYFQVIFVDWVFKNYEDKIDSETLKKYYASLNTNDSEHSIRSAIKKELWQYSYLYRCIISFEGKLIKELSDEISSVQNKTTKLDESIEINCSHFPYSWYLSEKVNKRTAYVASPRFKKVMDDFPIKSVAFELYNANPPYISRISRSDGNSSSDVDLVIAGLGTGSFTYNLKGLLRHITTLLKEDGGLYISFVNRENLITDSKLGNNMGFAFAPESKTVKNLLGSKSGFKFFGSSLICVGNEFA